MSSELTPERESTARGSVWDYISPSRLNCWLSCPLKFRLRYIDGLRSPATPALFLGKQVHAGLEVHYRHRQLGISLEQEDVVLRMDGTWEQATEEEGIQFDSAADAEKLRHQAGDLVRAYLDHVPDDEPRPLAVEATLESPLVDPQTGEDLGIPLLGIVDLVLDDTGGPTIADFKTSARGSTPAEISHEVQLSSYAYLFRQVAGREEACLEIRALVKTKTPKVEFHTYIQRSEAHFHRLFALVREYLDALDKGVFNYRPGWGCSMCDFRSGPCRRWCG